MYALHADEVGAGLLERLARPAGSDERQT
jgi:hypothetical protein